MYRRILVAMDGSDHARFGGQIALALAQGTGAELVVCHVYGAQMHQRRFQDMEPGLPEKYQQAQLLDHLRQSHTSLIEKGMEALSVGYVEGYLDNARAKGISVCSVAAEGRNYVQILKLARDKAADLIVLGAHGLGASQDGLLGSTASKVLLHAQCDVLVSRRPLDAGGLLAGIDGSSDALMALQRAADIARCLGQRLEIAAIYDPEFHTKVFRTLSHTLSSDRQQEVGLIEQEDLHDDLINDGLGKLYKGFLDEARRHISDIDPVVHLHKGKAYRSVVDHALRCLTDIVAVGRYGHHREPMSLLGSTAEAIVRLCPCNVLVTSGSEFEEAAPPRLQPRSQSTRALTPIKPGRWIGTSMRSSACSVSQPLPGPWPPRRSRTAQ